MTERLEDVRRRRAVIDDIGEVVGALRAIASGRVSEAHGAQRAISSYDAQVSDALSRLAAPAAIVQQGPGLALVVGAAQGFCGGYPARVAEAALQLPPDTGLLVIGQRTRAMLEVAGSMPLWSADMPTAARFVPPLASAVTDALLHFGEDHPGPIRALSGHDAPGLPVEEWQVWPPEASDDAPRSPPALPLTTLSVPALIRALLAEALFAEVARTLMTGLQIENRARVEAMARAQSSLKTRRAEVDQQYRQARQEQMTTEVIELSTAGQAAGGRAAGGQAAGGR